MLETTIRITNSSDVGTTGLTGTEIKFRRSPFGAGDEITIAGVSGGTNGVYLCSFIGVPYQAAQLWVSGVYQTTWGTKYIGDIYEEFLSKDDTASQTMAGAIAMGGNKITGGGAATANGDFTRWEQTGVITEARTISGQWLFSVHPSATPGGSTFPPTASGHYTPKWYVDDLFSGSVGMIQSTYLIKCLPTRSTEDAYSQLTVENCNTYLSGKGSITSYRGIILIEALGQTNNAINVDDGTNQWISAGVDIVGLNRPRLTRRGYNSSLTSNSRIQNCYIFDSSMVATRTYVNFLFKDCDFFFNATDAVFTGCAFEGTCRIKTVTGSVTMSNCTGAHLIVNDDITLTVSGTQPAVLTTTNIANIVF